MDISKRLDKLERNFFKEWVRRHPLLGTSLGFHDDADDRMPDGSIEKELDDIKLLRRTLSEYEAIDPKKLPPHRVTDRNATVYLLKNWLFDREQIRLWETSPEAPHVIGQSIFQILSRNYAPLGKRMRSIMKRLDRMPKYIDQSRSKLRRPSKLFVEIELETITRLPGFFNLLKDIGREHMPVTPQRDLNRLIDQAQNALERYSDWLIVDVLPDCREEFAIGEDVYRKLLHVRGVELSPGQLVNQAEAEIARLKERQREIARSIKRKVPVEDIRDMIKQQHPENFDGVLRFVRDAVGKARQFVSRSKFAAHPEGEQLYVIETPAFLRHFYPFGSYWPPGRFEARLDGYYFVTPGDCDSDKLKEHNYSALATMTIREGYPGRHHQMSWAIHHPSPLRSLVDFSPAYHGWGQYCEERAKEMGYDDTPPSRFMQLQASVMAAVRVLIDVRLSAGKMGYEDAVETLIDYLGTDRICAEAEARRFATQPGVPAVQFVGKERIKDLRKWVKEKLGSRFTESFFHTTFLKGGPIPIPLTKKDFELKIAEELAKPVEKPKEEAKKAGKKAAPLKKPAKAAPKPAPKKKAGPKPAKKKPKPAARRKKKAPKKKKRAPARRRKARPPRKVAKKRRAKRTGRKKPARRKPSKRRPKKKPARRKRRR